MNYSDTTSALVINKLTKSQYETLKASGSLQSNQIYITPETLPSNLGDFNNDVGYVTASAVAASYATKSEVETVSASVSSLGSSVADLNAKLLEKRNYNDLTVQNQIGMPPYYNIRSITWNYGTGETTYSNFWIDADKKRCWTDNTAFSTQIKTTDGQTFEFVVTDQPTLTLTMEQLKEGYHFMRNTHENILKANLGRGYEKMSVSWEGLGYTIHLNKFAVIDDADSYHNTWVTWYDGDLDDTSSAPCWYIRQTFSPGSSATSTNGAGSYYQLYYRYHEQDVFVGSFTDSSKMTRDTEWHETWTYEDHEGQTITRNYTIMATRNWDNLALESNLEVVSASVSTLTSSFGTLSSSVDAMGSQVSALASSMSGKRDYTDLTYSITTPSETIDNSRLHQEDTDVEYNEKLTFTVNDSVEGEQHLAYDDLDGIGMWIDRSLDEGSHHLFFVQYAADWGFDPADGKFVLIDSSDVCYQFDLQDGVNVQTFNYTSEMLESTGTLTMTFTGEQGQTVNDSLALQGSVNALASSVEANTSAISAMASSISAVAGSLNVSGIGCSTIVLSGTYSDSTSFAYNFVIQPSA